MVPLERNQDIDNAMIKIQILSFFLANPHTRDTARGFSTRLFMNKKLIDAAMQELVEVGIIEKAGLNDKAIYRLKVSYSTLEEYLA